MDAMRMKMLPHIFPVPKGLSSMLVLPTIIFAILNHSDDSQHFFLHHDYWSGGANLVMSYIIMFVLHYFRSGNKPSHFKIQADNSWKESKNRTIFATLAWLVHINMFADIELHCLIQGHTHEDIDQIFSSIARAFWIKCITTLKKFKDMIKRLFVKKTTMHNFTAVWNFEKFFKSNAS